MAFILSKLLSFFLHPFLWVLAATIAGLISKTAKGKKRCFTVAGVLLLLFSNPFLYNCVSRWWDYERPQLKAGQTYSCAIVLGGFISEDAQGNGYFNGAADRFIQGIRLKATGQASHILVTGGNASLIPDHFSEGSWVVNELKALHVPDTAVLIENKARNTTENARYSKQLLVNAHLQPPYLLVTSAFHMRRALATFTKEGIPVVPYACNFGGNAGSTSPDDFIPSAGALEGWTQYLKEILGWLAARFK